MKSQVANEYLFVFFISKKIAQNRIKLINI